MYSTTWYSLIFIKFYSVVSGFCRYNKTEDLLPGGTEMLEFTHVMVGVSDSAAAELRPYHDTHSVISVVEAFSRLQLNLRTWPSLKIITEPRIYLLKRRFTDS